MKKTSIALFIFLFYISACGDRLDYSPFQTNLPEYAKGLTVKNLNRLQGYPTYDEFKVAVIADIHNNYNDLDSVVKIINSRNDMSFVFVVGDLTNLGLRDEFLWFHDTANKLNMPYLTVIGNHDSLSKGKTIYRKMYGQLNYSFSFSGTKFIALNSNKREFPGEAPNLDWLRSELQDSFLYDNVVVFAHIQPSAQVNGLTAEEVNEWRSLMEEHNVKFSVNGHNHDFNYWIENNVHYAIVPRVKNVQYGILTISGDGVRYEHCNPACEAQQ
jgi:predicted phosphodiesterase